MISLRALVLLSLLTLPTWAEDATNAATATAAPVSFELPKDAEGRTLYPPFKGIAQVAEAQAMATQLIRPVAWVFVFPDWMYKQNLANSVDKELADHVVQYLQARAIVVVLGDGEDIEKLPPAVGAAFYQNEEGVHVGNISAPRVVVTNPPATLVFGHVTDTKIREIREKALEPVFAVVVDKGPLAPGPAAAPAKP